MYQIRNTARKHRLQNVPKIHRRTTEIKAETENTQRLHNGTKNLLQLSCGRKLSSRKHHRANQYQRRKARSDTQHFNLGRTRRFILLVSNRNRKSISKKTQQNYIGIISLSRLDNIKPTKITDREHTALQRKIGCIGNQEKQWKIIRNQTLATNGADGILGRGTAKDFGADQQGNRTTIFTIRKQFKTTEQSIQNHKGAKANQP